MRILLLLPDLLDSIGGIQTFNRCFVKALDELSEKHNLKINILVLTDTGVNKNLLAKYIKSNNISYSLFSSNRLAFVWTALMDSFDSDLVIFGHVNFSPLALMMENKVKKFLIIHGTDAWHRLPTLRRIGSSIMHKILSVSKYTANEMVEQNEIEKNKFSIFPNTLDPFYGEDIKLKTKKELGLPDGKTILSVSRLCGGENHKKIDLVIESMQEVIKAIPDTFYVIVGDGSDRKRLEDLALEKNVSENIIFAGRIPNDLLPSYYNASDLFILPSLQEGFGIVFLEAMFYRKPCVGAKAGGIPEVIIDGETGFLAKADDKHSVSECLIKLLNDNGLREKMGKSGLERLNVEFFFKAYKGRLERVLGELFN